MISVFVPTSQLWRAPVCTGLRSYCLMVTTARRERSSFWGHGSKGHLQWNNVNRKRISTAGGCCNRFGHQLCCLNGLDGGNSEKCSHSPSQIPCSYSVATPYSLRFPFARLLCASYSSSLHSYIASAFQPHTVTHGQCLGIAACVANSL